VTVNAVAATGWHANHALEATLRNVNFGLLAKVIVICYD